MKAIAKTAAVLVILGILIGVAYAQFAKPEKAVKYRKAVMTVIAQHFGRLGAVVKGKEAYDQKAFADNTAVIETLAGLPWEAFLVPGSDKGQTTMAASALENPDKMNSLAREFEAGVAKLSAAAQGGDLKAIKTQFGAVAKSCKSCHKQTRK